MEGRLRKHHLAKEASVGFSVRDVDDRLSPQLSNRLRLIVLNSSQFRSGFSKLGTCFGTSSESELSKEVAFPSLLLVRL